jgi:hypothetical protein
VHGVTVCVRNRIDRVKSFIKYAWNKTKHLIQNSYSSYVL